jgi:asparagine synthase (glutamine-hydrolysing)
MCGIAGYFGKKKIDSNRLSLTLSLMRNRGPDAQNYQSYTNRNENLYLLHSRLSIIDLSPRSNQPYNSNDLSLIFNGEIYNYREVRQKLVQLGHSFETFSDTEVLLKSYLEYGKDCVNHLNGMWAFAIWDKSKEILFLSRDRFAEKPLYYKIESDGIYFASEVKFIKSLSDSAISINENHLKRYLVYGYRSLYKSQETYFKDISEIDYATNLTVNSGLEVSFYKYWHPNFNQSNIPYEDALEETKRLLVESLKLRLRSDVPIAFCLSGGVDSASLVSIAKKVLNQEVETYSIIDGDSRFDESENINETIIDTGCKSSLINLHHRNTIDRLRELVNYHDAPVATLTFYIHSMLTEKVSKDGFKISVSGTGADEIFTGYYDHFLLHLHEVKDEHDYDRYLQEWEKYVKPNIRNPELRNPCLYIKNPDCRSHYYSHSNLYEGFMHEPFSINKHDEYFTNSLLRNRMSNELFHEGTRLILHEDDLNCMNYSIENRSPFLDHKLFEFICSIPNKFHVKNGYAKYMLRQSMKGILNEKVRLDRSKVGFNCSLSSIIDLKDPSICDIILEDSPIYDIVRKDKIESLLNSNTEDTLAINFIFHLLNAKFFIEQHG